MHSTAFITLSLLFSTALHCMDSHHSSWCDIVTLAQKTGGRNETILTYFSQQLDLSKPQRDLKFIKLQTGIHNLRTKEVPEAARMVLLNHLWLVQSQHEEHYLQTALEIQRARTQELQTQLAPHQEKP